MVKTIPPAKMALASLAEAYRQAALAIRAHVAANSYPKDVVWELESQVATLEDFADALDGFMPRA